MGKTRQYSLIRVISVFLIVLFAVTILLSLAAFSSYAGTTYINTLSYYRSTVSDAAKDMSRSLYSTEQQFAAIVVEASHSDIWFETDAYEKMQAFQALETALSDMMQINDIANGVMVFSRHCETTVVSHRMEEEAFWAFLDKFNCYNSVSQITKYWGEAEKCHLVLSDTVVTRDHKAMANQTVGTAYLTVPLQELLCTNGSGLQQILCNSQDGTVVLYAADWWDTALTEADLSGLSGLLAGSESQVSIGNYLALAEPLTETDLYLVHFVPKSVLVEPISHLVAQGAVLVAVLLALTLFGIRMISRRIHAPINRLIQDVQQIGTSGGRRLPDSTSVEIAGISDSINQLLDTLEQQNSRMLELHLLYRESQSLALQAQISPHFLYNTLECVRSIAQLSDAEQIVDILEPMIQVYRYSASHQHMGTVDSELDCVRCYGDIIDIRFGGRIRVRLEKDGNIGEVPVPRMVLQPIVENAINHAYADTLEEAVILVTARKSGDRVLLSVKDHGCGMDDQTLEALIQRIHAEKLPAGDQRRIGLRNVHQRIRREFGEAFGVEITSLPQGGTTVAVTVPLGEERGPL